MDPDGLEIAPHGHLNMLRQWGEKITEKLDSPRELSVVAVTKGAVDGLEGHGLRRDGNTGHRRE